MKFEEILIIKVGDVFYGIATSFIDQILRIPALTPLVLAPEEIRGLCAINGSVSPSLDLNYLLGLPKVDLEGRHSRLLTMTGLDKSVAFLVDYVENTLMIDEHEIEYIDDSEDAVVAIYKHENEIIRILDITILLQDTKLTQVESISVRDGSKKDQSLREMQEDAERFLIFKMEEELYSISIDILQEVLVMPDSFTELAGSGEEILGMLSLRGELLLVSDLRTFYGFNPELKESNRILLVNDQGDRIGLVVDEIVTISDFKRSDIDEMPENFQDNKLTGVIHNEEQLISMVGLEVIRGLIDDNERFMHEKNQLDEASKEVDIVMEVVVFKMGQEEYAIDIERVSEIIDMMPLTKIADAPEALSGVINIRGQVINVGSLYGHLGLDESSADVHNILICEDGTTRLGFCVDKVSDVLGIEAEAIRCESQDDELFNSVIHLDEGKRLVMLFDVNTIFSTKDVA